MDCKGEGFSEEIEWLTAGSPLVVSRVTWYRKGPETWGGLLEEGMCESWKVGYYALSLFHSLQKFYWEPTLPFFFFKEKGNDDSLKFSVCRLLKNQYFVIDCFIDSVYNPFHLTHESQRSSLSKFSRFWSSYS